MIYCPGLSSLCEILSAVTCRRSYNKLFVDVVDARLWIYGFMTLWSLRLSVFVKSFTLPLAYVWFGWVGRASGQTVIRWSPPGLIMPETWWRLRYACQFRHAPVVNTKGFLYFLFFYLYPPAR